MFPFPVRFHLGFLSVNHRVGAADGTVVEKNLQSPAPLSFREWVFGIPENLSAGCMLASLIGQFPDRPFSRKGPKSERENAGNYA